MSEFASSDDFSKAAGFVVLQANAAMRESGTIISQAGFFRRGAKRRQYRLVRELARELIHPANVAGVELVKNPKLAEAYCRRVVRKIEPFCVLQFKRNPNDAGLQPLYTFEQVLKDGIYKYLTRDTANVCLSGDWSPGGENEVALMLGL